MSFNVKNPAEFSGVQNLVVDGHTQLVDVECTSLEVSGLATVGGISCGGGTYSGNLILPPSNNGVTMFIKTENVANNEPTIAIGRTGDTAKYCMQISSWGTQAVTYFGYAHGASRNDTYTILAAKTCICPAWANSSDDRLKHNEKLIKNGLEMIRPLVAKKYDKTYIMKESNYNGILNEEYIVEAGFIAQEILETDLSFSVSGGDITLSGEIIEGLYGLNYNSIFTYGIVAIQELDKELQAEKEKNQIQYDTLSTKYNDLLARIEALENK